MSSVFLWLLCLKKALISHHEWEPKAPNANQRARGGWAVIAALLLFPLSSASRGEMEGREKQRASPFPSLFALLSDAGCRTSARQPTQGITKISLCLLTSQRVIWGLTWQIESPWEREGGGSWREMDEELTDGERERVEEDDKRWRRRENGGWVRKDGLEWD